MNDHRPSPRHGGFFHPVVMMLVILLAAAGLTYVIDAGMFERKNGLVIPNSFQKMEKQAGFDILFATKMPPSAEHMARAASFTSVLEAIPKGMIKSGPIIFMVLFVGGLFGVLRQSGAIDASVERLAKLSTHNPKLLAVILMVVLGLGSTFLGFISEYLVIIPLVAALGKRMGYPPIFAMAIVGVAAKIGYASSVTNPLALSVAQPLAGVPLFSGLELRAMVFAIFMALGMSWTLYVIHRIIPSGHATILDHPAPMKARHVRALVVFILGAIGLVSGARWWGWGSMEFSAYYIALALAIGAVSGIGLTTACDAFVDGMKSMMLAALLVGLASSVEIILQSAQVMDTIIMSAVQLTAGQSHGAVALGLMATEMMLDIFIPSVSGKAAVSMPILVPIANAAGIEPNLLILGFIMGSGLTNMVTPTSGMLLAYLTVAGVSYVDWLKFILPLFTILTIAAGIILWTCA
jgi:uncharacterized ion transporter superfamily protein YfcC